MSVSSENESTIARARRKFIDRASIESFLGADHVAWLMSHGPVRAACYCDGRAAGCWDANMLDSWIAYERLASLIRGEARIPFASRAGALAYARLTGATHVAPVGTSAVLAFRNSKSFVGALASAAIYGSDESGWRVDDWITWIYDSMPASAEPLPT